MADLSTRLKELKNKNNVSQTDIANAVGLSLRGYQRYERGERKPDSDTLVKLADYFHVSVDYLLGRENYWQGSDGNINVKVPTDIFNLDTDALKKKFGQD